MRIRGNYSRKRASGDGISNRRESPALHRSMALRAVAYPMNGPQGDLAEIERTRVYHCTGGSPLRMRKPKPLADLFVNGAEERLSDMVPELHGTRFEYLRALTDALKAHGCEVYTFNGGDLYVEPPNGRIQDFRITADFLKRYRNHEMYGLTYVDDPEYSEDFEAPIEFVDSPDAIGDAAYRIKMPYDSERGYYAHRYPMRGPEDPRGQLGDRPIERGMLPQYAHANLARSRKKYDILVSVRSPHKSDFGYGFGLDESELVRIISALGGPTDRDSVTAAIISGEMRGEDWWLSINGGYGRGPIPQDMMGRERRLDPLIMELLGGKK